MAENTNSRMVLLLIGGIPVTMILVSTWLWFFVVKGDLDLLGVLGTANQGTLVQPPRRIDDQQLKYFNRLRRFYVSVDEIGDTRLAVQALSDGQPVPARFEDYLSREHGRLQALTLSASGYDALFPEHGVDESTWYLVDPAGWVMMSYNGEDSYKEVISDLKFLLKNSGD
jgi:hypothetical protein